MSKIRGIFDQSNAKARFRSLMSVKNHLWIIVDCGF